MTPTGIAFVINRLRSAPDMDTLRRVWGSLGHDYQRDPDIQKVKNECKEALRNA